MTAPRKIQHYQMRINYYYHQSLQQLQPDILKTTSRINVFLKSSTGFMVLTLCIPLFQIKDIEEHSFAYFLLLMCNPASTSSTTTTHMHLFIDNQGHEINLNIHTQFTTQSGACVLTDTIKVMTITVVRAEKGSFYRRHVLLILWSEALQDSRLPSITGRNHYAEAGRQICRAWSLFPQHRS